tara:strand:- start:126 stop:371 length:246 start_codon:yes stop_codon:yes gene_type:complete
MDLTDTSLAADNGTLEKLEKLKEIIQEWRDARKLEILNEVVFLKSLGVAVEAVSEEATEETIFTAISVLETIVPLEETSDV